MDAKAGIDLFKDTFREWNEDKAPRLAAALAYYTAFSLAPLLLIAISIASIFYANAETEVRGQIGALIPGGGDAVTELLESNQRGDGTLIATLIGFATLLFGASGFFGQLQDSLNTIWGVQPRPDLGIIGTIRTRVFSFGMVLSAGFLVLVSLLSTVVLGYIFNYLGGILPGADALWSIANFVVSFALTTAVFALIFKVVPDVKVGWKDVLIGAVATAALFTLGQFVLNLYLSNQSGAYGAFGSLIVLLLWVFYSAQILFFGAEFTQVYARRYGSQIEPSSHAIALTPEARAHQGIPTQEQLKQRVDEEKQEAGPVVVPSTAPKPGAVTTAAGFALGWLLGKRKKN